MNPSTPAPSSQADQALSAQPDAAPAEDLLARVQAVIERIRPAVQSDGGDVELVEVNDQGVALIRLHGACIGCPSSKMTLHMGIERNLRERIPEITGVEQVH
ncbi:MAG: NifU family protein [Planctomycetota bacterium]